ncbi:MAG: T9SS C-terminal target domain-containing protein, partial [Bacteroidetes bacterium]
SLNTDSVLLFEEIVYNGIPVANITVTPNPACEYSSVTITDNSQNVNSYKLRIFDWSWTETQNMTYYSSSGDLNNDSIWYYCGDYNGSMHYYSYEDSYCVDSQLVVVKMYSTIGWQDFNYTVTGASVQFEDTDTTNKTYWLWNFDDGNTANGYQVSHTYASPGTYSVCMTAANPCDTSTVCKNITVTQGGATLASSLSNKIIQLYPNPANEKIQLNANVPVVSCEIHDITGKQVQVYSLNNTFGELDVSNIEAGVYFLKIYTQNKQYIRRRIVIE